MGDQAASGGSEHGAIVARHSCHSFVMGLALHPGDEA